MGTKLPSEVWIVKRLRIEAEGPSVVNNTQDSILIFFNSTRFKASFEDLAVNQKSYNKLSISFYMVD